MLELSLLRSGASQHVFVRADAADDGCVYKSAAFIDELLPGRLELHRLRPTRALSRVVYGAAFTLPRSAWHASAAAVEAPSTSQHRIARALRSCRESYLHALTRLHALHLRRARIRQFDRVLKLHARIADSRAAEVMLPCRILSRVRARLLLPSGMLDFEGPLIQQHRADTFFDSMDDAARFDWDTLISGQHRLWRHGFGIADAATAIGPFGWCLRDGQLRLADTGSLSDSYTRVQHCLAEVVEDRWRRRFQRVDGERLELARAYYGRVRPHLDLPTLQRTWRAAEP